jgi:hypothetical protein
MVKGKGRVLPVPMHCAIKTCICTFLVTLSLNFRAMYLGYTLSYQEEVDISNKIAKYAEIIREIMYCNHLWYKDTLDTHLYKTLA